MTTFSFDGVSSTAIPELEVVRVRRPLVGERRDHFISISGREGAWLFDDKPGLRTITLDIHLLADSFADRRAAVIELANLLDVAGMKRLIVDDEPDRFHLAKLGNAPDPEEWPNSAEFSVDLKAEPYSQALSISEQEITASSSPHSISFSVLDTVEGIPVIEVIANGGNIATFNLAFNGETFIYAEPTIVSGQAVTISSIAYVLTEGLNGDTELDGTFDHDDLSMTGVSGDFPFINPGANSGTFTWTGTATSATLNFYWRRRSR